MNSDINPTAENFNCPQEFDPDLMNYMATDEYGNSNFQFLDDICAEGFSSPSDVTSNDIENNVPQCSEDQTNFVQNEMQQNQSEVDPMTGNGRCKKGLSGYMLFSKKVRESRNIKNTCEVGSVIGEMWRKLDPKEREFYNEEARQLRQSEQKNDSLGKPVGVTKRKYSKKVKVTSKQMAEQILETSSSSVGSESFGSDYVDVPNGFEFVNTPDGYRPASTESIMLVQQGIPQSQLQNLNHQLNAQQLGMGFQVPVQQSFHQQSRQQSLPQMFPQLSPQQSLQQSFQQQSQQQSLQQSFQQQSQQQSVSQSFAQQSLQQSIPQQSFSQQCYNEQSTSQRFLPQQLFHQQRSNACQQSPVNVPSQNREQRSNTPSYATVSSSHQFLNPNFSLQNNPNISLLRMHGSDQMQVYNQQRCNSQNFSPQIKNEVCLPQIKNENFPMPSHFQATRSTPYTNLQSNASLQANSCNYQSSTMTRQYDTRDLLRIIEAKHNEIKRLLFLLHEKDAHIQSLSSSLMQHKYNFESLSKELEGMKLQNRGNQRL